MTVPARQWQRELAHAALIGWAGLDRAGWAALIDAAVDADATPELLCTPGVLATVDLVMLANHLVARGDPAAWRAAELLLMALDADLDMPPGRMWLAAACLGWPEALVTRLQATDLKASGWRLHWTVGASRPPQIVLRGDIGVSALCTVPLPGMRIGLCAAGYGGVKWWDAVTGELLGEAYDEDDMAAVCAFPRPDGRVLLAVGGDDGTVRLVDPVDGPVGEFAATTDGAAVDGLCAVALADRSPDDPILVTSSSAQSAIRLWDLSNGEQFGQILIEGKPARTLCALPLPDGRVLFATAHGARMLLVWDPSTGQPVNAFPTDHQSDVDKLCAVPHPDGRVMLASTDGTTVRLCDPTTGEPAGVSFASGHGDTIEGICPVPSNDGRVLIATASADCTARLWDAVTGEPATPALTGHPEYLHAVCPVPLPDGRTLLATGGFDGSVRLWDLTPGSPIYQGAPVDVHDVDGLGTVPLPDGRVVLVSGHHDRTVRCWDPATGQAVEAFIDPPDLDQVCVIPMPDGRTLEARFEERWIQLWDPLTDRQVGGEKLYPCLFVGDRVAAVCAVPMPDGRTLLAAGSVAGLVTVWDPATEAELGRIVHFGPLRALTGLPDGRLAVAAGHCLCVLDVSQLSGTSSSG